MLRSLTPQMFSAAIIDQDPDHVAKTIEDVLKSNDVGCVLAAHHTGSHYLLVVICPMWEKVWYLDSARPRNDYGRDYTSIKTVIDRYISDRLHSIFS